MISCEVVSERMNLIWGTASADGPSDGVGVAGTCSLLVPRILSRFWRMSFNGIAAWGWRG